MKSLKNKNILITGGTGSFGKSFVKELIKNHKNIKRLVIYSRDELKQVEMSRSYPEKKYPFLRYFIGDVRDKERLMLAAKNIDILIHAAALKHVPVAEDNPMEFVKTNIYGAQNIIDVSLSHNIKKVIALSTDKAAAPINLYGATKLCSDKLFVAANNLVGTNDTQFSVVRYGNVMGSRGSVIPLFIKQSKENSFFTVTDLDMTRFNITLRESVNMVIWSVLNTIGGEIVVPKVPSYRITDLVKAINAKKKIKVIGIRPGEKIHEDLITNSESLNTVDNGQYYLILPNYKNYIKRYLKREKIKLVNKNFHFNSGTNSKFLNETQIKNLIKKEEKFFEGYL